MKKIYCIITHKNTGILNLLINSSPKAIIYLYVDLKTDLELFKEYTNNSNVFFIKNRQKISWGSVSQIKATLELLKVANKIQYDYLFILSGDCLPLKKESYINNILKENFGKEFISKDDEMEQIEIDKRVSMKYNRSFFKKNKSLKDKIICKSMIFLNDKFGLFKNKNFKNLPKLYFGSNWFGISKKLCDYILDYLSENPSYLKSFENSICCDEVFFQTIVFNSDFNFFYIPFNKSNHNFKALRYIDWRTGPDFPRTLDENDFEEMKNSECIFARKINEKVDLEIYKNLFLK